MVTQELSAQDVREDVRPRSSLPGPERIRHASCSPTGTKVTSKLDALS